MKKFFLANLIGVIAICVPTAVYMYFFEQLLRRESEKMNLEVEEFKNVYRNEVSKLVHGPFTTEEMLERYTPKQ